MTGLRHDATCDLAAASLSARESRPRSDVPQGHHGGPIPPAAFLPIVKVPPQTGGNTDNLYCQITAENPTAMGTEETLSDVVRGDRKRFSSEYKAWIGIKQRCYNPSHRRYADYGGRGIAVCHRWRISFAAFLADVGPKPTGRFTLERIDNDSSYLPDNCCWASSHDQSRNRRSNVWLAHNGLILCLNDWAKRIGMGRMVLTQRLRRGWALSDALSVPVAGRRKT